MWAFVVLTFTAMAWYKLTQPRILVLHSYATDYSWTRDIDTGLKRVLDSKLGYKVQWHYMDTKNHPDRDSKRRAGTIARHAIEALKPRIIIAIDDDAQAYAVREYAGSPDVTIIFAGVNGSVDAYGYTNAPNVTGIYEKKPLQSLRSALMALTGPDGAPLGRRIMQIGDQSEPVKADVREVLALDWSPMKFVDSQLVATWEDWKNAVMSAKGRADMILISNYHNIYETADRKKLVGPEELLRWTYASSPVPVVGMGGFMVEEGGMFAVAASGFEQGEIAARLAVRVLDRGEAAGSIPHVMPRQFLVYMRRPLMEMHGISLPPLYESFARASNNYYE